MKEKPKSLFVLASTARVAVCRPFNSLPFRDRTRILHERLQVSHELHNAIEVSLESDSLLRLSVNPRYGEGVMLI